MEYRLMEQTKPVELYAQDYVKDRQFTDCIRTGSDIRICERRITELRASCNRNTQGQGRFIMEKKDYYDTIYEAVMNIELAMANLSCVRIAMKGNEDSTPSPETINDALCAVENLIASQNKIIDNAADKLRKLA